MRCESHRCAKCNAKGAFTSHGRRTDRFPRRALPLSLSSLTFGQIVERRSPVRSTMQNTAESPVERVNCGPPRELNVKTQDSRSLSKGNGVPRWRSSTRVGDSVVDIILIRQWAEIMWQWENEWAGKMLRLTQIYILVYVYILKDLFFLYTYISYTFIYFIPLYKYIIISYCIYRFLLTDIIPINLHYKQTDLNR